MANIIIADENFLFRIGIKTLLERSHRHDIVIAAKNAPELITGLRTAQADILLLNLALGGGTGESLIRKVKAIMPAILIIGLSDCRDLHLFRRAMRAGISGFVRRNCSEDELVLAINRVSAGRLYIDEATAERMATDIASPVVELPHQRLTERELGIFYSLIEGSRINNIAKALFLSVETISANKRKMLLKMDLHNTAELVRYAVAHELL
jgi:two-component system invasion response regulator UvrY